MKCLKIFILTILFQFSFIPYSECSDWDMDDIKARHTRMMQKLKEIETEGSGHHLEGTKNLLAYSTNYDKWTFIKSIKNPNPGQHIYLFKEGNDLRAIVWVDKDGIPIKVPPCPDGNCKTVLEPAFTVISQDVYCEREVKPGHGLVLLMYPTTEWINDLTKQ